MTFIRAQWPLFRRADRRNLTFYSGLLVVALLTPPAAAPLAQEVFAYPNEGQSQEQQDRDNFECHNWARDRSGFDPMRTPQATAPPPQQESTGPGLLGGAAVGAGAGVIGGAIAGNAGRGAAIGAATGGLLGGLRSRNQNNRNDQARNDWDRQQVAQYQQGRSDFNRAFTACMSGRGYTIM